MYLPNNKETIVTIANRQEGDCEDRYDDDNENDDDDDSNDDDDYDYDYDELCLLSFLTAS